MGKNHGFHFRLVIDLHSYFLATFELLEYFENFDNFDHIFYLTFEPFSTTKSGYDPVGPKIWIVNTNIWSPEDQAENIEVGNSFRLHFWDLKNQ